MSSTGDIRATNRSSRSAALFSGGSANDDPPSLSVAAASEVGGDLSERREASAWRVTHLRQYEGRKDNKKDGSIQPNLIFLLEMWQKGAHLLPTSACSSANKACQRSSHVT